MKRRSVCSIGTKLDARTPSLEWLRTIVTYVDHYLSTDSTRPGADTLKQARGHALLALKALDLNDAEGAAFFSLAALQAAWTAEMIEGRLMIDEGVKRYRASERANHAKRLQSLKRHDDWRSRAKEIREKNPRLSATAIAKLIDPIRWNTVRRLVSSKKK